MSMIPLACLFLAFALVLYGSLVPGRLRPRTGLDGHIEHAMAYGVCCAAILPFLQTLAAVLLVAIALTALAAILELAQLWVPGRSCRLTHFLAGAAGITATAIAGTALMLVSG